MLGVDLRTELTDLRDTPRADEFGYYGLHLRQCGQHIGYRDDDRCAPDEFVEPERRSEELGRADHLRDGDGRFASRARRCLRLQHVEPGFERADHRIDRQHELFVHIGGRHQCRHHVVCERGIRPGRGALLDLRRFLIGTLLVATSRSHQVHHQQ